MVIKELRVSELFPVSPATNTLSLKRRLMVKSMTAARSILAPATLPLVVTNRLGVEIVQPRAHVVMVFVGHLAIMVV